MQKLNLKDIYIIDSLPVYDCEKKLLNVGCGEGRIDWHLNQMGYNVLATDTERRTLWEDGEGLRYEHMDIFKPKPENKRPIVLCSETLEHLQDYKTALKNLLGLTEIKLIITVPHEKAFFSAGHVHFWDGFKNKNFKDIHEFKELCKPYAVSITEIRTKPEDAPKKKWAYVIIVDKRQKWE